MTAEPRVEELLATIRKAIDNDISELDRANPAKAAARPASNPAGIMRDMRVSYGEPSLSRQDVDQELARLRQRVGRPKLESQFPAQDTPPLTRPAALGDGRGAVSSILSGPHAAPPARPMAPPLRQGFAHEVEPLSAEPMAYDTYAPEPGWVEEAPPAVDPYYQSAPAGGALMSPQAAYAAQSSFQALANSMLAQVGGDGRLEEMAREILRPLLKQWLDDNLPPLVERLVRDEIERVARRGR